MYYSTWIPYEPPTGCAFCGLEVRDGDEHMTFYIATSGEVTWGCRLPMTCHYPAKLSTIKSLPE